MQFVQLYPYTPMIGDKQIYYAAHHSDLVRLQVLQLYGGIYLDWDGQLLNHACVLTNDVVQWLRIDQ